jgi:hypothetical protein
MPMQFISVTEIEHAFHSLLGGHCLVIQLNLNYRVLLLLVQLLCLANLRGKHSIVLFIKRCFMGVTCKNKENDTAAYK